MTSLAISDSSVSTPIKWQLWIGRGLSAFASFGLLASAAMKLSGKPEVIEAFTNHFGYPASLISVLAALEIGAVVIYLIPQTALLGAIIMTGYLGGAIATHARIGEPPVAPVVLALVAWAGLALREKRLQALFVRSV